MVDWGTGNYERTAKELEPVARAVVEMAAVRPAENVLDLACGTGNAALLAAELGARVIGVDAAARLLDVARDRARLRHLAVDFRAGDLCELPVDDDALDVVLSVFGVIFASDPAGAFHEIGRVTRAGGRALLTAWIPAGPIDAMLAALGRTVAQVTHKPPPARFPWSDEDAVNALAGETGLTLLGTTRAELAIRDSSPETYVTAGQEHPMALALRPVLAYAGAEAQARAAMTAVLREANEDPAAFLVHSPYVIHQLRID